MQYLAQELRMQIKTLRVALVRERRDCMARVGGSQEKVLVHLVETEGPQDRATEQKVVASRDLDGW